jgi:hypothetical protein
MIYAILGRLCYIITVLTPMSSPISTSGIQEVFPKDKKSSGKPREFFNFNKYTSSQEPLQVTAASFRVATVTLWAPKGISLVGFCVTERMAFRR